jgi:hypothetical protein
VDVEPGLMINIFLSLLMAAPMQVIE